MDTEVTKTKEAKRWSFERTKITDKLLSQLAERTPIKPKTKAVDVSADKMKRQGTFLESLYSREMALQKGMGKFLDLEEPARQLN